MTNGIEFRVHEGTQEAGYEVGVKLARGADAVWPETTSVFLEGVVAGVGAELSRIVGIGAAAATLEIVAQAIREIAASRSSDPNRGLN